ncbi:hypothetical protein Ddc_16083 [Ditylenchus destructor]|nr:hypothetical protein Ddc_16083 [Ditylenchus destructor]
MFAICIMLLAVYYVVAGNISNIDDCYLNYVHTQDFYCHAPSKSITQINNWCGYWKLYLACIHDLFKMKCNIETARFSVWTFNLTLPEGSLNEGLYWGYDYPKCAELVDFHFRGSARTIQPNSLVGCALVALVAIFMI